MNLDFSARPHWFLAAILPYGLSVILGFAMLKGTRGVNHYAPPEYGGYEPKETQRGAEEIVARGTTSMDFHTTGYPYLVAAVYRMLPAAARVPLSILVVQILCLPVVVWSIGRLSREFSSARMEFWGRWAAAVYYPIPYYAAAFNSIFITLLFTSLCLAWIWPLLRGPRSFWRSLLLGLGLGIVVCIRPNFALLGVVFTLSIWKQTRSFWEAIVRSFPIAAVSAGMLALMTFFNPPDRGEFFRGGQSLNRSILQGTYQYADQWWDWQWIGDPGWPGSKPYFDKIHEIERETGTTILGENDKVLVPPEAQPAMRREAWKRVTGHPWNTAKKILISTVRNWIFLPTSINNMPVKIIITLEEFVLLALALYGLRLLWLRRGAWELAFGVLLVNTMWSWILHVEPRYSLPGRGVELALFVLAVSAIWEQVRKPDQSAVPDTR